MKDALLGLVSGFPPELATFILSIVPATELRASLPIGITVLGLDPWVAFFFAVLGNVIPMIIIFLLLPPTVMFCEKRSKTCKRIFDNYFYALEKKHKERYDTWGALALVLFVSIPLPGSGAWTGSVLAVLFGIEKKYSIPAILAGITLSGLIVLGITQGALGVLSFLL
jgi:uncharacterized membrane protein